MGIVFNDSVAPATAARVTRGANLIARNLECHGAAAAVEQTADHIRQFWSPQLRAILFEQTRQHPERFSPIVSDAVVRLRTAR